MQGREYFQSLLLKYMDDSIAPEERADLEQELRITTNVEEWKLMIKDILEAAPKAANYDPSLYETNIRNILSSGKKNNVIVHRVHFLKTAWFRYAAAIIIVLGISTYL